MADLAELEAVAGDFERDADDDFVDPGRLSAVIDRLKGKLCRVVARGEKRGEQHLTGQSPCSWVAASCKMSKTSAADHLCVGKCLDSMPRIARALSSGEVGYQAVAVICHLAERMGEKRDHIDEEMWVGFAQRFSIKELRYLAHEARLRWDPEGFDQDTDKDYEQRYLYLSEMGNGMFKLDALLDHEAGVALKTAIDALSNRLGTGDERSPRQRRADALTEAAHHAMNAGTLPRRHRARPHITVHTTIEALKGENPAVASTLEGGMPISNKTLQRLACDGVLSRVVTADSVVIDVGKATPSASPAQWRALKARHKTCGFPCCDRPVSWTSPHHLNFRSRGGNNHLSNFLPLCYYHHRLVHEGGWQVVRAGDTFRFIRGSPTEWQAAA